MSAQEDLRAAMRQMEELKARIRQLRIDAAAEKRGAAMAVRNQRRSNPTIAKRSRFTGSFAVSAKPPRPQFKTSRVAPPPTVAPLNLPPAYED